MTCRRLQSIPRPAGLCGPPHNQDRSNLLQGLIELRHSRQHSDTGRVVSQRLQLAGYGDELDQLAREFNQAFAEIEKLMEATRHVSSAIAHDMRRPISALRYRLEELSRRPDLPEPVREDLAGLLAQTDESLNTFSALLTSPSISSTIWS